MVLKKTDLDISLKEYIKDFDLGEKQGVANEWNIRNQVAFEAFKIAINQTLEQINNTLGDLTGREEKIIKYQIANKIKQEIDKSSKKEVEQKVKGIFTELGHDENQNYGYQDKAA